MSQPVQDRVVADAPHGTLRGWSMGCGCLFCLSAKCATAVSVGVTREERSSAGKPPL
ncbi:MAG: hypothetical protein ACRDTH_21680 [Pseudonocardiaceae bacterium]